MIRLLAILIGAGLLAAGIAWIADRHGELVFYVDAYEARMSAPVAIGLVILFAALIGFATRIVVAVLSGPGAIGAWFTARRARRGHDALSRGLVAVAAGDVLETRRQAAKVRALLGEHPLALLLSAQAAQLGGDAEGQSAAYRAMLEHEETEFLGLRGLFALAKRGGDSDQAMALVARAHALKPRALWAASALFDLKSARGDWKEAQQILEDAALAELVDADVARRRRAVLLAAEALEADRTGDAERGLALALDALKLAPALVPAAVLAARKLAASGKLWRAQDVIEAAWTQSPHPDMAAVYAMLKPDDEPVERAKRLAELAHLNREHFESRMLEAEEAVHMKEWSAARRLLAPLAQGAASARVCALMAEIEEGERGDATAAHVWLTRAARAPRDAEWHCSQCGSASEEWAPVCATCGRFDTLVWATPETLSFGEDHPIATEGEGFLRHVAEAAQSAPLRPMRVTRDALPRQPDDPGHGGQDFETELSR